MVRGASAGSLTFVQLAGGKPSKILEKVEAGSDPALRRGASIALARLVVLRWAKKRSNTAEGRTQLLDWLDRAIRLYPPELSYVRLRRQLREAHGDLTGALKDARKILGIQGSTLQDQAELGRLAERAGEQKQARTSFEAYLAAGGREESVLLRLASIQEAGGATAEALKSYDRASLLAPRSARASTGKARCQLYLGQLTAAERTLVEARRLVGVDVRLVVEEARLAQLSRRTKAAVAKLEEAMRLGLGRKALREILLQRGLSSLRGHPVVRKLLGGT
jgi:tetratricopeptide (TPR) repeat protein